MESTILKELSQAIYHDALTLAYAGKFSDSLTDKIIGMAEVYVESDQQLHKLRRKTSFLVAECFQNVVRHSVKNSESKHNPMGKESFLIRFYNSKVYIASENTLPNEEVDTLRRKLDDVNSYEKEELKKLYVKSLEGGEMSDKGGAGLGLIEMARKTGNKLHYSFMSLDDKTSAFYLMLVLEQEDKHATKPNHSAELIQNEFIINSLRSENQFLLYHGDFAQDIISPVVEMIENNLDAQDGPMAEKIKFYNAATECMQNISHLSMFENERNAGTLSLGKSEKGYVVNSINPISEQTRGELNSLLQQIGRTSCEEIEAIVKERIKAGTLPLTSTAAQGFIDLARVAKEWEFSFETLEMLPMQFFYKVFI
jgi:hypothetical protein